MRNAPEQKFQIQVATVLRLAMPPGWKWTCFPSGGGGKVRGGALKAMGLETGWGDLQGVIPPAGRFWSIELKYDDGRPSADQLTRQEEIRASGAVYEFAWTIEEVLEILRKAGVPLRHVELNPALPIHTGWQRVRPTRLRVSKRAQKAGALLFAPLK